jgi:protein-disulfide isomerase
MRLKFVIVTLLLFCCPVLAKNFKDNYQADKLFMENKSNVAGNPKGKVTVVVFFDYFCLPCRLENEMWEKLIQKDSNIRLLFIDYPMFGDESTFFAKGALAAQYQNKYLALHNSIMTSSQPLTKDVFYQIAASQQINLKQLNDDINSKRVTQDLLDNMMLGNSFGVLGLPTVIIAYTQSPHQLQVFSGKNPDQLEEIIKEKETHLK